MTLSLVAAPYPLPSLCWSIFKLWPFYLRFKYDFLDRRHGRVSSCGFLSQIQVLLVSYILTRTVITTSMCFTHIKTLLLNTTRIRSFMLTSLKRALNHWKWGEHWT